MSYQVEFLAGEHIRTAAGRLVATGEIAYSFRDTTKRDRRAHARYGIRGRRGARRLWLPGMLSGEIWGTFNDVRLVYRPGVTADDMAVEFDAAHEARAKAYRESPEGQRRERLEELRVVTMQAIANRLMASLDAILAVHDLQMTIEVLCNLQKATDHVGVRVDRDAVIQAFARAGFEPGVYCDDEFKPTREIFARWLIGQALDGIQRAGTPHPLIHKFADQWRDMFGVTRASG